MSRKDQLIRKIVQEQFKNSGQIPELSKLALDTESIYKPTFTPVVPKPGAVSDADIHRETMRNLMEEFKNISDLVSSTVDSIEQQALAIDSEQQKFISMLSAEERRLERFVDAGHAKDVLIHDLPHPYTKLSSGISYVGGTQLFLKTVEITRVETNYTVLPYSSGKIIDHTPVSDNQPFPITYKATGTGDWTGLEIHYQFDTQQLSALELNVSGALVEVYSPISESDYGSALVKKVINGHHSIMFDNLETNYLVVRLSLPSKDVTINLIDCALYKNTYQNEGEYVSGPIKLSHTGPIELTVDMYEPVSTEVSLYVGFDKKVPGGFNRNPEKEESDKFYYDTSLNTRTSISTIYEYQSIPGTPTAQPDWFPVEKKATFYYNCIKKTAQESNYVIGSPEDGKTIRIATLDARAIERSISVRAGRNSWMFIPYVSYINLPENKSKQYGIHYYDIWTSYIVLRDRGLVTIQNPDGKIQHIVVQPIQVHNNFYPNTAGMIDNTNRTFSGTLEAGIYRVILYVNNIRQDDLEFKSAVDLTEVNPIELVSLPTSAELWIYPWPLTHTLTNMTRIHPVHAIQYFTVNGNNIIVPYLKRSYHYDILTEDGAPIQTIYKDKAKLSRFYDITYLSQLDESEQYTALFLRAVLKSNNKHQTPIIRGIDIKLLDELNEQTS